MNDSKVGFFHDIKMLYRSLGLCVFIGIVSVFLMDLDNWGVNQTILIWFIASTFQVFRYFYLSKSNDREGWLLFVATLFFSSCFTWRDSGTLHFLSFLALFFIFLIQYLRVTRGQSNLLPKSYFVEMLKFPFVFIFRGFEFLFSDIGSAFKNENSKQSAKVVSVLIGFSIAVPIVIVFVLLLMSSDQRYENFVVTIFDIDIETFNRYCLVFAHFFTISAAMVKIVFYSEPSELKCSNESKLKLGAIESNIILSAINMVFLSYIVVQFSYLFGDDSIITTSGSDWVYSSYAKRGFYELLTVAILVVPMNLILDWLQRENSEKQRRFVRYGILVLSIFVGIISFSALHRMFLYINAYGLTEQRFYSVAIMLIIILFLGTVVCFLIRQRRHLISKVVIYQFLFITALLIAINPDGVIARTNLSYLKDNIGHDLYYLKSLSCDADSTFDKYYEIEGFQYYGCKKNKDDWRGWNLSRHMAFRDAVSDPG